MSEFDSSPAFPAGSESAEWRGLTKREYEEIHRKNSREFQVYLAALTGIYAAGTGEDFPNRSHLSAVQAAKAYEADKGAPR